MYLICYYKLWTMEHVTGSNGKKADCRNITLIMTSNLGAEANGKKAT